MRCVATAIGVMTASAAWAQEAPRPALLDDGPGIAAATRLFAAKCAECHGSHLAEPKGDIGFILDVPRLIEEHLVVPGKPDASDVFTEIVKGKMPPADSGVEAVTAAELAALRAWIAGTPVPAAAAVSAGAPKPLVLLGRLHPVIVHFPIALLIVAAFAELLDVVRRAASHVQTRNFCLSLGAISAVAATGLGWLMAWADAKSGDVLELHRWLGTASAAIACGAAIVAMRMKGHPAVTRGSLILAAAVVSTAAHFGGVLVFGPNFFNP